MTSSERMALIYGLSVGGAALLAYSKGTRGFSEIGTTAALHGALVGTGLNVVFWLQGDAAEKAHVNQGGQKKCPPYGKLAQQGVALLSQLNTSSLYKKGNGDGVYIEAEGKDPSRVILPVK